MPTERDGRWIEVTPARPAKIVVNGVATVVAAGALVFSVGAMSLGPALDQAVRWYSGISYPLTAVLSPTKAKAKPLDTPGSTYATTYGSTTLSSYTSGEVLTLEYTPVPLVYAITEPLPGAVTTPSGDRIGYIRATTDDQPALFIGARHEHPDHPKHVPDRPAPPVLQIRVSDGITMSDGVAARLGAT